MTGICEVRAWRAEDLETLHAINEGAVPGVNTLSRAEFDALLKEGSDATRVAELDGRIAGFVTCMFEGRDYASRNYIWLSARFGTFAYIDRVAVAADARGAGIGAALYQDAFRVLGEQRDILLAEVNLAPPNPGSVRFHRRLGFQIIGERWTDASKGVVYVKRPLR